MLDKQSAKVKFLLSMVAMTSLASFSAFISSAGSIAHAATPDTSHNLSLTEQAKSSDNLTENLVIEELDANDTSLDGCLCQRC